MPVRKGFKAWLMYGACVARAVPCITQVIFFIISGSASFPSVFVLLLLVHLGMILLHQNGCQTLICVSSSQHPAKCTICRMYRQIMDFAVPWNVLSSWMESNWMCTLLDHWRNFRSMQVVIYYFQEIAQDIVKLSSLITIWLEFTYNVGHCHRIPPLFGFKLFYHESFEPVDEK